MDGLPTPLDFPACEKTYSHVSARHMSDASDSSLSSPTTSQDEHFQADQITQHLTPTTTRNTVRPGLSRDLSRFTTHGTTYTSDPSYEVDFEADDPQDPRNWPTWYKGLVVFAISFSTLVVVVYSTSYTATFEPMSADLGISSTTLPTLGITTYLIGIAIGSLVLAPISETYGRKPVYVIALSCFFILVIPCALAKNITTIIVVRLFGAIAGSACIANAPGTIGDIVSDEYRALVFSIWSIGPMNGPVFGPIIGGFVTQYTNWRWANWLIMIWGGIAFLLMSSIRETYAPALLQQKAKKLRKSTGENRHWSRYDVRVGFLELMKVNLSRPFVMAFTEPICIFWNVYIGIIYGILYLCFVAYPIVYTEHRGWTISQSSLAFVGIGVGNMITICCATPIKKMIDAHRPRKDPRTGVEEVPPESMMSVVCIAAVCIPVGELWFAWTCLPASIHPAISIAAGIPFGAGNGAVFIYASNYLVHSYGIYAASAMAGNAVVRSILGGTLPLAGQALYSALGANWAGTMLGLLEVAIIPIPFIFYKYGYKIREKSTLIREMRELEERRVAKQRKEEARAARLAGDEKDVPVIRVTGDKEIEAETGPVRVQEWDARTQEDV